jgi:hypothetical protein
MSGLWAEEVLELRKKVEELEAGLDLCVRAFHQYRQSHDEYRVSERQFAEPMRKAFKHPALMAAEERRKEEYWQRLERVAKRVESWPAWMKGERENKR